MMFQTSSKNTSVNNIYAEWHVSERDDRCGDVVEGDEAAMELLVSHEQLAEAVEPTVADLDHPAARLLGRIAPLGISFLAATDHMRDVAVRLYDLLGTPAPVASVGTQVLAATHARGLALDHDCL